MFFENFLKWEYGREGGRIERGRVSGGAGRVGINERGLCFE